MQETFDFLKATGVNFVATIDGNRPSCRPFGDPFLYDGKIYCITKKYKNVVKQLNENPTACIVAYDGDTRWMRIRCELINDSDNIAAKETAIAYFDWAKEAGYTIDNPDFQIFYIHNAAVELLDDDKRLNSWSF